jgi:hypothetical protein
MAPATARRVNGSGFMTARMSRTSGRPSCWRSCAVATASLPLPSRSLVFTLVSPSLCDEPTGDASGEGRPAWGICQDDGGRAGSPGLPVGDRMSS